MKKAEIIEKTLRAMKLISPEDLPPFSDEPDEEEFIISVLQDVLPDGDIKTCEDFRHLNVECCETCHKFYPHYEMSLIDLPDGQTRWQAESCIFNGSESS